MPGDSTLAILMFSTCFFHFWCLLSAAHNFMKSRSPDGLAVKGPNCIRKNIRSENVLTFTLSSIMLALHSFGLAVDFFSL